MPTKVALYTLQSEALAPELEGPLVVARERLNLQMYE
jgi:hypothetical protein